METGHCFYMIKQNSVLTFSKYDLLFQAYTLNSNNNGWAKRDKTINSTNILNCQSKEALGIKTKVDNRF